MIENFEIGSVYFWDAKKSSKKKSDKVIFICTNKNVAKNIITGYILADSAYDYVNTCLFDLGDSQNYTVNKIGTSENLISYLNEYKSEWKNINFNFMLESDSLTKRFLEFNYLEIDGYVFDFSGNKKLEYKAKHYHETWKDKERPQDRFQIKMNLNIPQISTGTNWWDIALGTLTGALFLKASKIKVLSENKKNFIES